MLITPCLQHMHAGLPAHVSCDFCRSSADAFVHVSELVGGSSTAGAASGGGCRLPAGGYDTGALSYDCPLFARKFPRETAATVSGLFQRCAAPKLQDGPMPISVLLASWACARPVLSGMGTEHELCTMPSRLMSAMQPSLRMQPMLAWAGQMR